MQKKIKVNRVKMCKDKVSFHSVYKAKAVAEKYNQSVYECPVCFCFHTTSREDWKEEFVTMEKYERLKKQYDYLLEAHQNLKKHIKAGGQAALKDKGE